MQPDVTANDVGLTELEEMAIKPVMIAAWQNVTTDAKYGDRASGVGCGFLLLLVVATLVLHNAAEMTWIAAISITFAIFVSALIGTLIVLSAESRRRKTATIHQLSLMSGLAHDALEDIYSTCYKLETHVRDSYYILANYVKTSELSSMVASSQVGPPESVASRLSFLQVNEILSDSSSSGHNAGLNRDRLHTTAKQGLECVRQIAELLKGSAFGEAIKRMERAERSSNSRIYSSSEKQQKLAHSLAQAFWESPAGAQSRAMGSGICDFCNDSIRRGEGFLTGPITSSDFYPSMACVKCFESNAMQPWDGDTSRMPADHARAFEAVACLARGQSIKPVFKGFMIEDAKAEHSDLSVVFKSAVAEANSRGLRAFAYFYADWCPPCRALRASLSDPLMIDAFHGTYIVRLPADAWKEQSASKDCPFSAIPVFFRLDSEGKPLDKIEGDAWGANTPANMAGPLKQFFRKVIEPASTIRPSMAEGAMGATLPRLAGKKPSNVDADDPPMIRFRCPSCNQLLKARASSSGRHSKCPKCKNPATIPAHELNEEVAPEVDSTKRKVAMSQVSSRVIPKIAVGMEEQAVERLLGKPRTKRGGDEILKELGQKFRISGEPNALESAGQQVFAIYDHPAGQYNIVYLDGKVVEVHSHPSI